MIGDGAFTERGPDCFVEIATQWLQRPFAQMSETERGCAINEICLLISQMRYRDPRLMEVVRSRWVERIAVRLCSQVAGMKGYESCVRRQLNDRVTVAMLSYHKWREQFAPVVRQETATGPSDGGEVTA